MAGEDRVTLLRPPPADTTVAPIENALDVVEMSVLGPDVFTNARPLWQPPGARGIYGGAVIAQCLASGQRTVPDTFLPHSCHCYFLLAGDAAVPILYHVERVRDGRSFATRTVQARQRGRCIFTTTISFVKETTEGERRREIRHAQGLPAGVDAPEDDGEADDEAASSAWASPIASHRLEMVRPQGQETPFGSRKTRQWFRARGRISEGGGLRAHLNALAYITDSYFIGTVSRVHQLWRFPFRPSAVKDLPEAQRKAVEDMSRDDGLDMEAWEGRPEIGMQVSLDHSIYFHEPGRVRADEWMLVENESPWSGDGRGVVLQRVWAKDGTLLATCMQEVSFSSFFISRP